MMNSLQTLTIQNKQYELLKVLGQGSFGKVYLAQIKGGTNQYAVKEQNQITDEEFRFCQFVATKKFKNLVNLFSVEMLHKKIYMVMEYCQISLYDKIQQKTFDTSQMRFVMKEIANGIKELHDMGLAHRDLKPENILIQEIPISQGKVQERYKICDFGTVKEKDRLQTKQVGTPYYLAPEQLDGNENYTLKADVWSFGALCYELLTNKPLFDGMTVQEIEKKIKTLNIDQEIDKLKNMERHHYDLFKKMLERNPNNRCDINYVIANIGETIRTKSINRVDPKMQLIQKQQPAQIMEKNQQNYLAAVQSHQQTIQPTPQNQVAKPSIIQNNTDQPTDNISNHDRKTQHIANNPINQTLQKTQSRQFVPSQFNEQNKTLNRPVSQAIPPIQQNCPKSIDPSQFVAHQQNINQDHPVNQDVKINEQSSKPQPKDPQSQLIQSQQQNHQNQFKLAQQNQNLHFNQSMNMDSQNQQNSTESKPLQQFFQDQSQKVSLHMKRNPGGIDQSTVQMQEQNKKNSEANNAQFSNYIQPNSNNQHQKPPLNSQIKQIGVHAQAQTVPFKATTLQNSQGSAVRGRPMDFKQDNITPVQKSQFMSPQLKNPNFIQNTNFRPV